MARQSVTGKYIWRNGELIKVSDRPPTIHDAYVPQGGYWDESLGRFDGTRWKAARVESREQKSALMKQANVVEDGGFKKPIWRKYFT